MALPKGWKLIRVFLNVSFIYNAMMLLLIVTKANLLSSLIPTFYSLAYLVVPNTEDQFSQPFLSLSKI